MSRAWARRTLWLVLLLTLPVPMSLLGGGRAPTLALLEIAAYVLPVWLTEGGPGARLAMTGFALQGLLWAVILYIVARIVTWILARFGDGRPPIAAVAVIVVGLFVVSLFPIYVSPIIARGVPVNILGVY